MIEQRAAVASSLQPGFGLTEAALQAVEDALRFESHCAVFKNDARGRSRFGVLCEAEKADAEVGWEVECSRTKPPAAHRPAPLVSGLPAPM